MPEMNARVWESWFIIGLCKEIPFSIILKNARDLGFFVCLFFFLNLLTFDTKGENVKKASFYTSKSIVFIIIFQNNGNGIVTPAPTVVVGSACTRGKQRFLKI